MNQDINIELEELFNKLDNSLIINNIKVLKDKIDKNTELVNKINKLNNLNKYSEEYKSLKIEIYNNEDFKKYNEYLNEINLLLMSFNNKMKLITGGHNCESH